MSDAIITMIVPEHEAIKTTIGIYTAIHRAFKKYKLFDTISIWVASWVDKDYRSLFERSNVNFDDYEEFDQWCLSDAFLELCEQGRIIYDVVD